MKYIELFGNNIARDIDIIKTAIQEDSKTVFLYSGVERLYDYIDHLSDPKRGFNGNHMDDVDLYRFKVCYEEKKLDISCSRGRERASRVHSMGELIGGLDGKSQYRIIVEGDDRMQLAFIVQQLIFLEYPLETVDILLRKEFRDADKTRRFMENVNALLTRNDSAISMLAELRGEVERQPDDAQKDARLRDIDETLDSCRKIREKIAKALDVELKLAVAASKKTGKSVIVNCFVGEEIAPTSTELATPNNCIYRRSPDQLYRLQLKKWDEKEKCFQEVGERQTFAERKAIHEVINEHFRSAQNDRESGFTAPDMDIEYVTEENNFSSYTIYDTAGPDAAGARHWEVAMRAIRECDVALFAIDYAKHLTKNEEAYLGDVKKIFMEQNKFHSLLFALNKMDVKYTDSNSPKSAVKTVDYIKTRLADINEAYKDCIVFPTSSLEFFDAIVAEKGGVTELLPEHPITTDEMKTVKFARKDVPELAWLHTHAENLEYYHGIKTFSYDEFKKDSGMPALMGYVSYVAKSKARDEIVNNVAFEIDVQKAKIQGVLDNIRNIEALINADDEKISEISQILSDYTGAIQAIFSSNFREEDLDQLGEKSLLRDAGGSYEKMISNEKKHLEYYGAGGKRKVADALYTSMVERIWAEIPQEGKISGYEIDRLFSAKDFQKIVDSMAQAFITEEAGNAYRQLSQLRHEVGTVVNWRQERLQEESDRCRERLEKEHISILLPELPNFEFAAQMRPLDGTTINAGVIRLGLYEKLREQLFEKTFFGNVRLWVKKNFGRKEVSERDWKLKLKENRETFLKVCRDRLYGDFKSTVYENNIPEHLVDELCRVVADEYMKELLDELNQNFGEMNGMYMDCVRRFQAALDDREKYKADIELHNRCKENIVRIEGCTAEFMEVWNMIVCDLSDASLERKE